MRSYPLRKTLVVPLLASTFIMAVVCVCCYCLLWKSILLSCNSQSSNNLLGSTDLPVTDRSTKTIYVITPTYKRVTQKVDLTSMCHTLMNVPDLVWIVIEDAPEPTDLITRLLQRCKVKTVHLVVPTSEKYIPAVEKGRPPWSIPRGVEQRNEGLNWLRKHFSLSNCSGVLYFGDDDNKYDLRLFNEVSIMGHVNSNNDVCIKFVHRYNSSVTELLYLWFV